MVCEVTDEWTGLNMFRLSCADNVMAKQTNNSMQNILGNVFILFSNSFLLLIKKRTGWLIIAYHDEFLRFGNLRTALRR